MAHSASKQPRRLIRALLRGIACVATALVALSLLSNTFIRLPAGVATQCSIRLAGGQAGVQRWPISRASRPNYPTETRVQWNVLTPMPSELVMRSEPSRPNGLWPSREDRSGNVNLTIPIWPVGLLVIGGWIVLRIRAARSGRARCQNCRYDLHGLPATAIRCPECGQEMEAGRTVQAASRSLGSWLVCPAARPISTRARVVVWILTVLVFAAMVIGQQRGWQCATGNIHLTRTGYSLTNRASITWLSGHVFLYYGDHERWLAASSPDQLDRWARATLGRPPGFLVRTFTEDGFVHFPAWMLLIPVWWLPARRRLFSR